MKVSAFLQSCCGRFGLAARAAAILQERPTLQRSTSRSKASELQSPPLAYEIIQGPLVRKHSLVTSGTTADSSRVHAAHLPV